MRRSLLPVILSKRKNISKSPVMLTFQTFFLTRSDGLNSKFKGGCAICLLVSDVPVSCCCCCCCCCLSSCSCSFPSWFISVNFLSLSSFPIYQIGRAHV